MTRKPQTPSSKAASKTATKPASVKAPSMPPQRRAGRTLTSAPVELPRVPGHHFGLASPVGALQTGDVIYVGSRHKLSILEVLTIEEVASPARRVEIRTAAVSAWVDGVEYVDGEELVLHAAPESRVAVRSFPS